MRQKQLNIAAPSVDFKPSKNLLCINNSLSEWYEFEMDIVELCEFHSPSILYPVMCAAVINRLKYTIDCILLCLEHSSMLHRMFSFCVCP